MKTIGFGRPLYILPFDHRGSFETKMFGWHGDLSATQTAEIAAAKQVIYDGFKAAIAAGVPKDKAGILVDEQFVGAILRDARTNGYAVVVTDSIFVVGDIARFPHVLYEYQFLVLEHWDNAVLGSEVAAHNMVSLEPDRRPHIMGDYNLATDKVRRNNPRLYK